MVEKIPLHSPSGVGLVVATIVAALIVLGFCAALDNHYRRQRQRDLRWYADRLVTLQRQHRTPTPLADTTCSTTEVRGGGTRSNRVVSQVDRPAPPSRR